jgi:hypothetical protein
MNEHDAIFGVDTKGVVPASKSEETPSTAPRDATLKPKPGGLQMRVVTTADAIAGLDEIFRDLQTRFHDQWNWIDAAFYVECLRCTIEDLTARPLAPSRPA